MNKKILIIFLIIIIGLVLLITLPKSNTEYSRDQTTTVLSETSIKENIVGTWLSTQDPKSIVVYRQDNTVEDIYDDQTLGAGSWDLYTDENASYNPSGFFLRTTIGSETYEYAIISTGKDSLSLNYLARGNTLEYTRVK